MFSRYQEPWRPAGQFRFLGRLRSAVGAGIAASANGKDREVKIRGIDLVESRIRRWLHAGIGFRARRSDERIRQRGCPRNDPRIQNLGDFRRRFVEFGTSGQRNNGRNRKQSSDVRLHL